MVIGKHGCLKVHMHVKRQFKKLQRLYIEAVVKYKQYDTIINTKITFKK